MHGIKRRQWTEELLKQKKLQDQKKISEYRDLTKTVLDKKRKEIYTLETFDLTTQVLKINPEFNSVWNYRRDIINSLRDGLAIESWEDELNFTMAQMKVFPKVYWIWNHRVWILNNYPNSPLKIWQRELVIASKVLEMDARNYHAWHYRRIIVNEIEKISGKSMDKSELEYTTLNINQNISNFSSWHQRAKLLPRMFSTDEVMDKKKFINDEVSYITNAMFTDAEDQSVWLYIKWFIKNEIVSKTLSGDEYQKMLKDLKNNILAINEDEVEFSGVQNNWCLKILIVIEDIETSLGITNTSNKTEYIEQLIEADPLRKNRYMHLLNKH
ncbi:hypothetical protein Kpol_1004p16 [Vanderwaltozyma polyspora DSM 70294]|uniref:Geranylgeranyl transferase type-2 subunit alpha n=1 Tax=Vanderwaltozyma polyspora (strain ATCC 22028 / DSM 70294 / BCRC 21397 / CBS 2163 / NBRC 10782 / NRRL Y-8283 / UCD 57-17) TaxID=436907 RepID=A7TJ73_VANPO|nr:uncharacterized protein Kpol_1004p16 [Vanderwaltozyma polyspora DSM 70294]EDO17642.1 hypothetical protein Kpol_1004p16 [Vanderwaltozyma polyspora DSM 70294]